MKLRKISIKNLASLPYAEIDFTVNPLNNSSLFLICGDTGAGKSTITDAICLSLYGKTPRFEIVGKEDVNLQEIKNIADSRNMMRKSTAEAWARTEFLASDNKIYVSEWSVNKARGKIDGALQPAKNSLFLLVYGSRQPVTDKQREFSTMIEQLTGLDFDKFTRSVMLAQNQFSKFLNASKDEKAKILEILTDTSIYSEISKKIFERYNIEKNLDEGLKIEEGKFDLLTDQQIIERDNKLQQQSELLKLSEEKISDLENKILYINTKQKLESEIVEKQKILKIAEANFISSQSSRNQLNELNIAFDKFAVRFDNFYVFKNNITKENDGIERIKSEFYRRKSDFVLSEKVKNNLLLSLENLKNRIEQKNYRKTLFDNYQVADLNLKRIAGLTHSIADLKSSVKTLSIEEATKKEIVAKHVDNLINAQKRRDDLKQLLDVNRNKQIDCDLNKLLEQNLNVDRAIDIINGINDKNKSKSECNNEISILNSEADNLKKLKSQADNNYTVARDVFFRVRDMAAQNVENLRNRLIENSPCPVCGSTSHPFASDKSLVDNLVDKAEADFHKAETIKLQTDTKLSDIINRIKVSKENYDKIDRELEALNSRLNKAIIFFKIDGCESVTAFLTEQKQFLDEQLPKARDIQNSIVTVQKEYDQACSDFENLRIQKESSENTLKEISQKILIENKSLSSSQNDRDIFLTEVKNYLTEPDILLFEQLQPLEFKDIISKDYLEFKSMTKDFETQTLSLKSVENVISQCKDNFAFLNNQFPGENADVFSDFDIDRFNELPSYLAALKKSIEETRLRLISAQNGLLQRQSEISDIIDSLNIEGFDFDKVEKLLQTPESVRNDLKLHISDIDTAKLKAEQSLNDAVERLKVFSDSECDMVLEFSLDQLTENLAVEKKNRDEFQQYIAVAKEAVRQYSLSLIKYEELLKKIDNQHKIFEEWAVLNTNFGSSDGQKLSRIAQSYTLKFLLDKANEQLAKLSDKYELTCELDSLAILVYDGEMCEKRPASTLSGGESFMVSLSLALGLSDMMSAGAGAEFLFIDEGFGTLSGEALASVIKLLGKLERQGRKVGIISHVPELQEKISTKIRVIKSQNDNTQSTVTICED